jgi:hypothetical protein
MTIVRSKLHGSPAHTRKYVTLIAALIPGVALGIPTSYLADEISGVRIGHYHGNPAHNPVWHYDKVVKVWWQYGHGVSQLWGEFTNGHKWQLPGDFNWNDMGDEGESPSPTANQQIR